VSTPKTLVIGSTGHKYVTCVSWDEIKSVNIVDFEVVVVCPSCLTTELQEIHQYDFLQSIRKSFARLLKSKGKVIVLGEKRREIVTAWRGCSNYSWSPIDVDTVEERGDTITLGTEHWKNYFSRFKEWDYYYSHFHTTRELKEICGQHPSYTYSQDMLFYAVNRYEKLLSVSLSFSVGVKNGKKVATLGEFILLPHIQNLDHKEGVNIILEELLSLPQTALPPSWVENVPIPLVSDIQKKIEEKKVGIEKIQDEIIEHEKKKHELEKFKKLLFVSGTELEEIFSTCLEKCGGRIESARYSQEEFVLHYKGGIYLIECKGISKSVSLTHVRQLVDYILKFEEDENKIGKGILFGNAWKDLPPDARAQRDTPFFPENILPTAVRQNIAMVASTDFYYAFCKFLEGSISGEEILDAIVGGTGVVKFNS